MKYFKLSGNYNFAKVLFTLFLAFKLAHIIDWSWWWISAPLWGILPYEIILKLMEKLQVKLERMKESLEKDDSEEVE